MQKYNSKRRTIIDPNGWYWSTVRSTGNGRHVWLDHAIKLLWLDSDYSFFVSLTSSITQRWCAIVSVIFQVYLLQKSCCSYCSLRMLKGSNSYLSGQIFFHHIFYFSQHSIMWALLFRTLCCIMWICHKNYLESVEWVICISLHITCRS